MPTMHGRSNESKEDPPNEKNGNLNNCLSVQGIIICMTVPNLKGSLPEERAQFGRSTRLCCNCLKLYQRLKLSRKKGACKDCGRKHSSLLPHPPVAGGNANKDQVPAGKQQENPRCTRRWTSCPKGQPWFYWSRASTRMSKATVCLPVVPVKATGIWCEKPGDNLCIFGQWCSTQHFAQRTY